jgi:hypothetical protein
MTGGLIYGRTIGAAAGNSARSDPAGSAYLVSVIAV